MRHRSAASALAHTFRQAIEGEVNHRCRIQREHLAEHESAHDRDAQRTAELRAGATAESERHTTQYGCHGGHEDGTESQQTRLVDRVEWRLTLPALRIEREVDHHDAV